MSEHPVVGVIGGTGVYHMPELENPEQHDIETPFGRPSSPVIVGELSGHRVAFLARHGIGHTLMPGEVNYRANIYALKSMGVERILGVNACGSLRKDYAPGHLVVPDQLLDFTRGRKATFFGEGVVVHISAPEPFCPGFSRQVYRAAERSGAETHPGGSLVAVEGPRFSTRLESNMFRSWGLDVIGMTSAPEAFLAREAEICYSAIAHVTDYDVWHAAEDPVSVEMILQTLQQNTQVIQQSVRNLMAEYDPVRACGCPHALRDAIATDPQRITPEMRARLGIFINKYLAK